MQIDQENYEIHKIIKTIEQNYKKDIFFEEFFITLKNIFFKKHKFLCDLNIDIIEAICLYLEIKTKKYMSSDFKNKEKYKKNDLLRYLLTQINCHEYFTTLGAKDYLGNTRIFPSSKIKINYFTFNDLNKFKAEKKNCYNFFSIIDSIFKHGKKTKTLLNKNFKIVD